MALRVSEPTCRHDLSLHRGEVTAPELRPQPGRRGVSLRHARAADLSAMAAVHIAAVQQLCRTHYPEAALARWTGQGPQLYRDLLRFTTVVVAQRGTEMVGFAAVALETGHVRALYVAPTYAGLGIGARLLARVERLARACGTRRLYLEATLNAQAFYEKMGYRDLGPGLTGLGLPCRHMIRRLAPSSQ